MIVQIDTILAETPTFWVFFCRAGAGLHKCVAGPTTMCRPPAEGETWRLQGEERHSPVHGTQFHVTSAVLEKVGTEHVATFLAKHRRFRNIGLGQARIRALCDRFGADVVKVLDAGDHAPLIDVMPFEVAMELSIGWQDISVEARFICWAAERGIAPAPAMQAYRLLGAGAQDALAQDPYLLVAVMDFAKVDSIARRMGVLPDDVRRQVAAVKAGFHALIETGSTAADPCWLIEEASKLGVDGESAVGHAIDAGVAYPTAAGLQPAGCFAMERAAEARLSAMLSDTPPKRRGIEVEISRADSDLLPAQADAVRMAMENRLCVICGGAGTGKTTTLKALVKVAAGADLHVAMCAVSGQAAGRMRAATGAHAQTVAALLKQTSTDPLPAGTMMIVDESSMADLRAIYRLLEILPEDGRLVFVGDPAQLPAPGFGLVFHILAATGSVPRVELTQIMRQRATSGIPVVAQAMRAGALPALPGFEGIGEGVVLLESNNPVVAATRAWETLSAGPEGAAGVQILTALRADVRRLNERVQGLRNGANDPSLADWGFRCGDHVVCTRNDYSLGIWNGSLGVIHRSSDDGFVATIDDEEILIPDSYMGHVQLGYAVTVHKAQGSQFPRVIIPVVESRVLDRALIYTAVTRARTQAVLVGDRGVIEAALAATPAAERRQVAFRMAA